MRMTQNLFAFKLAYGTQTAMYPVGLDDTMEVFINNIKTRVYEDFDANQQEEDIEIVEAGNFNNINGPDAEMAPALELYNDITFREYFVYRDNPCFYIRKVHRIPTQEHLLQNGEDQDEDLCVICMEEQPRVMFRTCRHVCTCHNCFNNLRGTSHSCPLCRTYIDDFIVL
jgi:hypothetical protein